MSFYEVVNTRKLCGRRYDLILVESNEKEIDSTILNEQIFPMASCNRNVRMMEGLEVEDGWANYKLFFTDSE